MAKPLHRQLEDESIPAQMERLFAALDDDNRVAAIHARRWEREQLEKLGIKKTHELHAHGELFGMTIKGETVTLYIDDDENWHPVTTFHKCWLADLAATVENMTAHLATES